MAHLSGTDRSQLLLLPEAVGDYVGRDNPVRFIEVFVDGLDLAAAGFVRLAAKETGRPGYDPADLLKLYRGPEAQADRRAGGLHGYWIWGFSLRRLRRRWKHSVSTGSRPWRTGYFKIEDIEACEKAGITAYVPKPIRGHAVAEGF
jgi:hypothetical protein